MLKELIKLQYKILSYR